jgi:alanine dehydrogenase
MGADARGKQEIHAKVLQGAKVVIDDWRQACHSGEINVPLKKRQLRKRDIHAELGEIVAGLKRGRSSEEEITLFDSTGLAIQDVSCGYAVYRALRDEKGIKGVKFFNRGT